MWCPEKPFRCAVFGARGRVSERRGGACRASSGAFLLLVLALIGCSAPVSTSEGGTVGVLAWEDSPVGLVPAVPDEAIDEGHGHHGDQVPYWLAADPHVQHDNGHLWMVSRALDLVAKHRGRGARATTELMRAPECEPAWQQGLVDADYLREYNSGRRDIAPFASILSIAIAGASWEAHFFDPEKNENYNGNGDTAYTRALHYAADAKTLLACDADDDCAELRAQFRFDGDSFETACYAVGLALHYTTDITQPMHAANFTAKDFPAQQHTNVERYATEIQDRYAPKRFRRSRATLDEVLMAGALKSKAQWPGMQAALDAAYERRGCYPMRHHWFDDPACWNGDEAVDASIGQALKHGARVTADAILSMNLAR